MSSRKADWEADVCGLLEKSRKTLSESGTVCAGSGGLFVPGGRLWVHSDFGPAEQDKNGNEDYVLAWSAGTHASSRNTRWAIAMADGVTSSHLADVGAKLACWTGMASLVANWARLDGSGLARQAMCDAGRAIGIVGDEIARDADRHRPEGEFPSTWEFILNEGLLLQTTLTLVWCGAGLSFGLIGDGGAVIKKANGDGSAALLRRIGSECEETSRVHALGPRNRDVERLDVWEESSTEEVGWVGVFTDGIGRGVGKEVGKVAESADMAVRAGKENPAREVIESFIRVAPTEFEDNLSLALVEFIDKRSQVR